MDYIAIRLVLLVLPRIVVEMGHVARGVLVDILCGIVLNNVLSIAIIPVCNKMATALGVIMVIMTKNAHKNALNIVKRMFVSLLTGLASKDVKVMSMVQIVTNCVLLTVTLVIVISTLVSVSAYQGTMGKIVMKHVPLNVTTRHVTRLQLCVSIDV